MEEAKSLHWMGDSRERLREFPKEVTDEIGFALYAAENGDAHPSASPMQGCGAVEIVSDYDGDTFRGIYTTKFKGAIYVLHCFQKKSHKGAKTPKRDKLLVEKRLKDAEKHFKALEAQRCQKPK